MFKIKLIFIEININKFFLHVFLSSVVVSVKKKMCINLLMRERIYNKIDNIIIALSILMYIKQFVLITCRENNKSSTVVSIQTLLS